MSNMTVIDNSIKQAWYAVRHQWTEIEGDESQGAMERQLVDALIHLMRAHECVEAAAVRAH